MSFEIGKKCEGLHEGCWYVCTILACEKTDIALRLTDGVDGVLNLFARALRLTVGKGSLGLQA